MNLIATIRRLFNSQLAARSSQLNRFSSQLAAAAMTCVLAAGTAAAAEGDWPQWGGTNQRNMANTTVTGLPTTFDPGKYKAGTEEVDLATTKNIQWVAKLGSQTYGNPVIAGGRVYVGTNNESPRDPQHVGDRVVLMRRIQDIRTSERRFYQKITDIYATSIDYDPTQEVSLLFFKTVQNKVHWAITGQTAAEIVHGRVDAAKPTLGLTNWRGAVIRKPDVIIAKNYLTEPELAALNNLVEQYLVFAQGQAMRRIPMHMADWISKLDAFLTLNDRDILTHAGRISHDMAQAKAELEYDTFRARIAGEPRPVDADFDTAVEQLPKLPKPKKLKPPKRTKP